MSLNVTARPAQKYLSLMLTMLIFLSPLYASTAKASLIGEETDIKPTGLSTLPKGPLSVIFSFLQEETDWGDPEELLENGMINLMLTNTDMMDKGYRYLGTQSLKGIVLSSLKPGIDAYHKQILKIKKSRILLLLAGSAMVITVSYFNYLLYTDPLYTYHLVKGYTSGTFFLINLSTPYLLFKLYKKSCFPHLLPNIFFPKNSTPTHLGAIIEKRNNLIKLFNFRNEKINTFTALMMRQLDTIRIDKNEDI